VASSFCICAHTSGGTVTPADVGVMAGNIFVSGVWSQIGVWSRLVCEVDWCVGGVGLCGFLPMNLGSRVPTHQRYLVYQISHPFHKVLHFLVLGCGENAHQHVWGILPLHTTILWPFGVRLTSHQMWWGTWWYTPK
jgi:hypothetical protein